ncbi:hypothetical protein BC828DRAFT_349239 [Blastocladiella britannica]|nr:hypothetical protein BC828DRAFT_349239 [Blastocladiella britannica]
MDRFWAFSSAIEAGYHDDLPYHNRVHAADVLHTISCFVQLPEVSRVVSDLDLLSILVAAAIHDYDHPGFVFFPILFLINTQDPRAILYNDKAILENHHLASSFALLRKPELNFAAGLSKVDFKAFRELVIEMVLATDLSQHLPIISIFKNRVIQGNMDPDASREDRVLLFKMMMKCSDVSNPTKEWSLYEVWYKRILDEFFRQGDIERRLGLDVSPFMDRDKVNIPSCQLGFVDFVVMPLYTAFNLFAPVPAIMQSLANNRDVWSERVKFGQSTTNLPAPPTVPTATAASAAAIHTSGPIHASLHSMPRGSTLSPAVSCKSPSASQGASGQVGSNDSG